MTSSSKKVFVAGHRGLVGSAITRALQKRNEAGESWEIITRSRAELDLLHGAAVREFFPRGTADSCGRRGGEGGGHQSEQ